jgi:hypothetical protein
MAKAAGSKAAGTSRLLRRGDVLYREAGDPKPLGNIRAKGRFPFIEEQQPE